MKSHATHAVERGISVDFARNLRGFCVGFARNLILFLFEREREGCKRFAVCTVVMSQIIWYRFNVEHIISFFYFQFQIVKRTCFLGYKFTDVIFRNTRKYSIL